jgi:hypothetical protein
MSKHTVRRSLSSQASGDESCLSIAVNCIPFLSPSPLWCLDLKSRREGLSIEPKTSRRINPRSIRQIQKKTILGDDISAVEGIEDVNFLHIHQPQSEINEPEDSAFYHPRPSGGRSPFLLKAEASSICQQ